MEDVYLFIIHFSTVFPSWQVRFFLFSLGDAAATLTVKSRTLRSGVNDGVLWLSDISHSYSWERIEATFSSSDNSKVREGQDVSEYMMARYI